MSSIEHWSRLVGDIYDCAIAPERWGSLLERLCCELNLANGVLAVNALPSGETSIAVSVGITQYWLERMGGYGEEVLELWGGPPRIQEYPLEEPIVESQATDRTTWQDNRYFTEWVVPQGLNDAVAIVLARDQTMVGSVTFGRRSTAGNVSEAELALLRLIAPHLRRAVTISKLLDAHALAASTFSRTLDALTAGVVLVNERLEIVHANKVAAEMLAARMPIRSRNGHLTLPSTVTTSSLHAAVALAAHDESKLGRRGLGIPIRYADAPAFVAHVLPLSGRTPQMTANRASAAVFIAPAASPPNLPGEALAMLYDLTPAELRTFELIADGRTPHDVAAKLGIAHSTVKTHLQRVFEKTGCNRQADLVRLAASLSLPV